MRELLTGADLFSYVKMLKLGTTQSVLIVEGPSDSLTLTPHVDPEGVRIIAGYGRDSVEEAITLVDSDSVPYVVALLDSDASRFLEDEKNLDSPNVVFTEHYDLESDVFFAPRVAERVIYSQAARVDVDAYLGVYGYESAIDPILTIASAIGRVRVHSIKHDLKLNMRDLPIRSFISEDDASLDIDGLATVIASKSKNRRVDKDAIVELFRDAFKNGPVDRFLCCGHDIVNILSVALEKWWKCKVSSRAVAGLLRAVLSMVELGAMKIYRELEEWASSRGRVMWIH